MNKISGIHGKNGLLRRRLTKRKYVPAATIHTLYSTKESLQGECLQHFRFASVLAARGYPYYVTGIRRLKLLDQ